MIMTMSTFSVAQMVYVEPNKMSTITRNSILDVMIGNGYSEKLIHLGEYNETFRQIEFPDATSIYRYQLSIELNSGKLISELAAVGETIEWVKTATAELCLKYCPELFTLGDK